MKSEGLTLEIPGKEAQIFTDLFLDYTGTLSLDGILLEGIKERLVRLSDSIRITVCTADTFGTAREQLEKLPVAVHVIHTGKDKAKLVRNAGGERIIAIGNGRNDIPMLEMSGLSIAVIGPEGAAGDLLRVADVVVTDIRAALDLLIHPIRLKATLRD